MERINSTDNMVWLPTAVHKRVSAEYSRNLPDSDMTLRNSLNGRSWDRQYDRGVRAVNRAIKEQEQHDSQSG